MIGPVNRPEATVEAPAAHPNAPPAVEAVSLSTVDEALLPLAALREEAGSLGVEFGMSWGMKRLQKAIDEARSAKGDGAGKE